MGGFQSPHLFDAAKGQCYVFLLLMMQAVFVSVHIINFKKQTKQ